MADSTSSKMGYIELLQRVTTLIGRHARNRQGRCTASEKGDGSPVTEIDRECEQKARDLFAESAYDYPVLGEEFESEVTAGTETYWIVDPIDGTRNYIDGYPLYNSTTALVKDGELYAGCIFAPELNEMYCAVRGDGAFRGLVSFPETGTDVSVSTTTDPYDDGGHFGVTSTFEMFPVDRHECAAALPSKWQKDIWSGALELAWVANGNLDGLVVGSMKPWDCAAGILLIREAGGRVATPDGDTSWAALKDGGFIASNGVGQVHDCLLTAAT